MAGRPTRSSSSGQSNGPFSRPRLSRAFATSVGAMAQSTAEVRAQVVSAFQALPFHGPPIELPCGSEVVKDSWLCALETELDAYEKRDELPSFDLEAWLRAKVNAEGSDDQIADFAAFVQQLDDYERPEIDETLTALADAPLREVEVYRDLSNLELNDRDDAPQEEENHDHDEDNLPAREPPREDHDDDQESTPESSS
mmetsp:Transcript_28848/g.92922  ORF Transcript_28848/g.92922 Transcript_28848/m.92922 type:complete len:198 (+) Transcript_28848:150-743(+)|eukprot:CAMPEP_0118890548 /NCGR_PEP_ID=MMETSP1166-20130328/950_1 /TAXON_ID=1104430 /ORGANISM="Chrysoreinhardia sp, Strain CCMP3193" /LENGTH=197 /DNA_ID=CAMNT_0006829163 /DNA_START=106 /DNA_END=699 /DNA_ORIENTATION=-